MLSCEPTDLALDLDQRAEAIDIVHAATSIYTSAHVVDAILQRVGWPGKPGVLLDPSCGDGSFLLRALTRLDLETCGLEGVARVRGMEFHSGAVASARNRIADLLAEHGWAADEAASAARSIVIEADFLVEQPPIDCITMICGNPPYQRWSAVPEFLRDFYQAQVAPHARGDLMHAFLARCADMLPVDGVIGLVLADRFLFNETAADLRTELGKLIGIDYLARLDPTTSFYRPKTRSQGSPPRIHPVEVIFSPAATALRAITGAPICPDGGDEVDHGTTLGDVAEVRLAPWLGPKGIFVINTDDAAGFPSEALVPAVDTDDIDSATDELGEPTRFALLTRRDVEPTGAVSRHLNAHRNKMPSRGKNRPFWLPPETITLSLDKPCLLIPRIAKRLRAIELPAGVLPLNHNLSVVAVPDGMSLSALRDLITGPASQEWIARNAPRLEGGYLSITTKLLRRMPVAVPAAAPRLEQAA